jgi:hypothetical protein
MPKRVRRPKDGAAKRRRGPRGGKTTMTEAGLVRKTVYFTPEEWEAVRLAAYERDVAFSHIVQEAVRAALIATRKKEESSR